MMCWSEDELTREWQLIQINKSLRQRVDYLEELIDKLRVKNGWLYDALHFQLFTRIRKEKPYCRNNRDDYPDFERIAPMLNLSDRHKGIFLLWLHGKTYKSIGDQRGLTGERVRQIVTKVSKHYKRYHAVKIKEIDKGNDLSLVTQDYSVNRQEIIANIQALYHWDDMISPDNVQTLIRT